MKEELQQTFIIIITNLISKNPEDMSYAKLLMGSYFGISVLYIELNCNNRYTRYDQYLLFKKQ